MEQEKNKQRIWLANSFYFNISYVSIESWTNPCKIMQSNASPNNPFVTT